MPGSTFRARLIPMTTRRLAPWFVTVALVIGLGSVRSHAGNAGEIRARSFRLLNEGVSAYSAGRYDEAEDKLRQASEIALNNFRAYLYHGLALSGLRRHQEALASLEVALDLEPTHLQALTALGDTYLALGDIGEARAGYFRALKVRAEYPAALDGLARSYEASADFVKAIELYRRAIATDPGFAAAYTHLGELYLRQENYREAVELLAEAVEIRPDNADGLNRLALAYGQLGLFNEAVATITRAIELEPNSPDHPATLGTIQVDLGLLTRAEASFSDALERDPGQPLALRGRAEIARRAGAYDAALDHVDRALADERLRNWLRERLTAYRERVVAERDRIATLESAAEAGLATPDDLRDLATIYAGRGLYDLAAETEARADPEGATLDRLGYLLLRADRYREALDIFDRLVGSDPGRAAWQFNRGVALAGLGRDEDAAAAFATVGDDLDLGARAGLYRANALLRLGRTAEAADAYVGFLENSADSEAAERVRRILASIAPGRVPTPAAEGAGRPGPAAPAERPDEDRGS